MTAQSMEALAGANEIRIGISRIRRYVEGLPQPLAAVRVADALEHDYDEPAIGAMRAGGLLAAIHRFGPARVRACLRLAGVESADRRVRELSERQRRVIAGQLRLWAAMWQERAS
jgi:hypothetical protein